LRRHNKAASESKNPKRKRIQKGGGLSRAEIDELLNKRDVEAQLEGLRRKGRSRTGAGRGRKRHRKSFMEVGHNSRTCKKDTVDVAQ
jgi:hypothetical protein